MLTSPNPSELLNSDGSQSERAQELTGREIFLSKMIKAIALALTHRVGPHFPDQNVSPVGVSRPGGGDRRPLRSLARAAQAGKTVMHVSYAMHVLLLFLLRKRTKSASVICQTMTALPLATRPPLPYPSRSSLQPRPRSTRSRPWCCCSSSTRAPPPPLPPAPSTLLSLPGRKALSVISAARASSTSRCSTATAGRRTQTCTPGFYAGTAARDSR